VAPESEETSPIEDAEEVLNEYVDMSYAFDGLLILLIQL
jgi:hypothetical protein